MSQERTVALHTLGCKLNYSETSAIERLLEKDGFVKKDFTEEADVYVINTCSVTENADKECRQIGKKNTAKSSGSNGSDYGLLCAVKAKRNSCNSRCGFGAGRCGKI